MADAVNIGLSEEGHAAIQMLKDAGVFNEMQDAYRFAIALAIARGKVSPETTKFRSNWHVNGIDKDESIRTVIMEMFPAAADRPYAYAERLADAGVLELGSLHKAGTLRFADLFAQVVAGAGVAAPASGG
ncbi:MAG TPA: hypothetical protein VFC93_17265 [Chloroflexota bacterium]|nr:hypothetical protein [Chloroflexota bacterium]